MSARVRGLIAELRRRRVFLATAVYAGAAFVLAQVADIFLPGLQLPDWTLTLVLVLLVMGLPLVVVIAWVFDVTPEGVVRTPPAGAAVTTAPAASGAASGAPSAAGPAATVPAATETGVAVPRDHVPVSGPPEGAPPQRSVAVLPFVDMSPDHDQEYFSDGITEELLNVLTKVPELRVPARTSSFAFKGRHVPVQEVARALRVAHVLEGSVRKSGERVRITAQLIEAGSGYHLWSESYDRELSDIFAVQDEISREIAGVLRCHILEDDIAPSAPTRSTAAHTHYLKGRFYLNKMDGESLHKAIEHYEAAIGADPEYALAHFGLAEAYAFFADAAVAPLEVLPRIEGSIERALELAPNLAEAHALLGAVEFNWGWDWERGRRALERALELAPSSASAHMYAGVGAYIQSDFETALEHLHDAERLDPLSPLISFFLGLVHLWRGDYDAAITRHAATQELAPGFVYHDAWVGEAYRAKGMWEEAMSAYRAAEAGLGRPSSGLAVTLVRMGRRDEAEAIAAELERRFEAGQYMPPELIAQVHVAVGRNDDAFRWLDRAVEAHSAFLFLLDGWGDFEPLRDDPRYAELMARIRRA